MSKVAILLAVHNGAPYLDAALESVCNQSFTDWEVLAVENGSTDETLSILRKWEQKDTRIKVFVNDAKGKNRAYNRAFQESKGDFLCFLAADDILHPDSLQIRLQPMLNDDTTSFTTCLLQTISADAKFDGIVFPKNHEAPNYSGGSIFFTKDLANKVFPIPEHLPNEDVWTALHLKNFGTGKHLSTSLYYYRIHDANSYGYHVDFKSKRKGFLVRMTAFRLFLEKYNDVLPPNRLGYLRDFANGRDAAEKNQVLRILFGPLPLKDKIIFIYYCSSFLFWLKQRMFKLLSGKLELV